MARVMVFNRANGVFLGGWACPIANDIFPDEDDNLYVCGGTLNHYTPNGQLLSAMSWDDRFLYLQRHGCLGANNTLYVTVLASYDLGRTARLNILHVDRATGVILHSRTPIGTTVYPYWGLTYQQGYHLQYALGRVYENTNFTIDELTPELALLRTLQYQRATGLQRNPIAFAIGADGYHYVLGNYGTGGDPHDVNVLRVLPNGAYELVRRWRHAGRLNLFPGYAQVLQLDISVDTANDQLYLTDFYTDCMEYALDGTLRRRIGTSVLVNPYSVTYTADRIYVTDLGNFPVQYPGEARRVSTAYDAIFGIQHIALAGSGVIAHRRTDTPGHLAADVVAGAGKDVSIALRGDHVLDLLIEKTDNTTQHRYSDDVGRTWRD